MTARQLIDALGGSRAASKKLNVPFTTVDTWRRKDAVPKWRLPPLVAAVLEGRTDA